MNGTFKKGTGSIVAICPGCDGATSVFVPHSDFSKIIDPTSTRSPKVLLVYVLMRCSGCNRGGLATVECDSNQDFKSFGSLKSFYPYAVERAPLPEGIPPGVKAELREAEDCAATRSYRGATALLRSALEKTLRANGYAKQRNLKKRIEAAATDGIISPPRERRAHENVRVLGNDILHEEWRAIELDEYAEAHHYTQRIIEDFYDHREEVEKILVKKKRPFVPSAGGDNGGDDVGGDDDQP